MKNLFLKALAASVLVSSLNAFAADKLLTTGDNVRITLTRGRSVADVKNGSIGEKLAEFEPVVRIQNSSFNNFPGNRVCVVLLGEDTTLTDNWRVIYRREFDADLLASKTFEWVGDSFKQGFDRTLAKSGYDYDGFIVIIKNSEGKPVISAQTKPFWTKDLDRAWNLEEGKDYNKSFFKK